MGACLSACVNFATYLHDKYNDWRWDSGDDFRAVDIELAMAAVGQPAKTTSIHTTVIDRNIVELRRILKENKNSKTETNSSGETALHLACKLGYVEVADELLDGGCVPMCTDLGTPIHCILKAVKTGYLKTEPGTALVHRLVRHGCDINAADRGEKTALFCAAEQADKTFMELLINQGASLNCRESNSFTPLYMSVIRGDLPCVQLLLSNIPEVEVDSHDSAGRTPLMAALITIVNNLRYERLPSDIYCMGDVPEQNLVVNRHNRIAMVEALLQAGADPNIVDNHGRTPLTIAFVILELDNIRAKLITPTCTSQNWTLTLATRWDTPSYHNSGVYSEQLNPNFTLPESVYAGVVRLLLLYGARFPEGWQKDYSKAPEWMQKLHMNAQDAGELMLLQRPHTLLHLARTAIRIHLAQNQRLHKINMLPIPSKLQDYVSISYL